MNAINSPLTQNSDHIQDDKDWIDEQMKSLPPPPAHLQHKNLNENANVKWNVNDTCKRIANFELTESKKKVINDLRTCNFSTSPAYISELLRVLFVDYPSKEGHWLYVAQTWNPRAINRVLKYMVSIQSTGRVTLQNPAAYFTRLIQLRKKRRRI